MSGRISVADVDDTPSLQGSSPRGETMRQDAGDFYIVNTRLKGLTGRNVDPKILAREMGLLKDWEALSE
jgi:hypothetical protein